MDVELCGINEAMWL